MSIPVVTLGGIPLNTRDGDDHGWTQSVGVYPDQRVFVLSKDRAEAIHAKGLATPGSRGVGPLTYEVIWSGNKGRKKRKRVKGLYSVGLLPGADTNTWGIRVTDQRYWFSRQLVERSYNMRRRSGQQKVLDDDIVPIQVAASAADFTWRRFSLKGDTPWLALEVLWDVLSVLTETFRFECSTPLQDSVEGLELHDPGSEALARVFSFLPGLGLVPGDDGFFRVINTLDQSEVRVATAARKRALWYSGDWRVVDRAPARPRYYECYFIPEKEMRFDYYETGKPTHARGKEEPFLQNVIKVPDAKLQMFDGTWVNAGAWVQIDDYLLAINNDPRNPPPAVPGDLTQEFIREWYLAGWTYVHEAYTMAKAGVYSPVWSKRVAALQEHWRRSYRIDPAWMDKLRSVKAKRPGVLDQETGTEGGSLAYCDHIIKANIRTMAPKNFNDLGWEIEGWATKLDDAEPSPVDVEILDGDVGILRITPRIDPWGQGTAICLGQIDGTMPKCDAGEADTLWASRQVRLSEFFRLAVVLTIIQDVPQGLGRLHKHTVAIEEAAERLPGVKIASMETPAGQQYAESTWQLAVGEETARFGWTDANALAIKNSIWIGTQLSADMLLNPDTVKAAAEAYAARALALVLDRGEGSFEVSLDPSIQCTGNLRAVTNGVRYSGGKALCYTRLTMPPLKIPPSMWSLMPEGVRSWLKGEVEQ